MNRNIFFIVLFFGFSFNLGAQESKIKITQVACVDISKIINAVEQDPGKKDFLLRLEEGYKEASKNINLKIQELEKYLEDNQSRMSLQNIQNIKNDIEFKKSELEKILTGNDNDSIETIILKGIYYLIKNIAEEDGLSVIIEKTSGIVYFSPDIDITDKVIDKMISKSNEVESE